MKTLILMRHGNASEAYDDFLRQLTNTGRMRSTVAGQQIKAAGLSIGAVICSDAPRAKMTAQIVCRETGVETLVEKHFLYTDYTTDDFTAMLEEVGDKGEGTDCLIVVGHNPNISYNANTLIGKRTVGFAPAEAIVISFDTERWADIAPGTGKEVFRIEHSLL